MKRHYIQMVIDMSDKVNTNDTKAKPKPKVNPSANQNAQNGNATKAKPKPKAAPSANQNAQNGSATKAKPKPKTAPSANQNVQNGNNTKAKPKPKAAPSANQNAQSGNDTKAKPKSALGVGAGSVPKSAKIFPANQTAREKFEEQRQIYLANRTKWLEGYWEDENFQPESKFLTYVITGKLVKINNYDETAGTESLGIYRGYDREGRPVFIKISRFRDEEAEQIALRIKKECRGRKGIVQFLDVGHAYFYDEGERMDCTYQVMEFGGEKSIEDLVFGDGKVFTTQELTNGFLPQMIEALKVLGNLNPPIFHSDLKPANIMYNEETGTYTVIDFGTAREIARGGEREEDWLAADGWTENYRAPELTDSNKQPDKADYYSLGEILFFMITGGYRAFWVLPGDKQGKQTGRRRITLSEYAEQKESQNWFSARFARLYDGLTRDYADRFTHGDIEKILKNQEIPFEGEYYLPGENALYKKLGEEWVQGRRMVFASTTLQKALQRENELRDKLDCLNRFVELHRQGKESDDVLFAKFLLEMQKGKGEIFYRADLVYMGVRVRTLEEFAEKLFEALQPQGVRDRVVACREMLSTGLLSWYLEVAGMKDDERIDVIEYIDSCKGKQLNDANLYEAVYRLRREAVLLLDGVEYRTKAELFAKLQSALKESYDKYALFCNRLKGNLQYAAWKKYAK